MFKKLFSNFKIDIQKNKNCLLTSFFHLLFWTSCATYMGSKPPAFDSILYQVDTPKLFYVTGKFSFFNFDDKLHGYSLGFISLIFSKTASLLNISVSIIVMGFLVILFTAITSWLIPGIVKSVVPNTNTYILSIATALFMVLFWRGYLQYFLSDIPALVCFLIAVYLLLKPLNKIRTIGISLFGYLAINMRMAYIIGFGLIVIIYFINLYLSNREITNSKIKLKKYIYSFLLLLLGFIVVALPQLIINKNVSNKISIFPNSEFARPSYATSLGEIKVGSSALKIFQLSVGLGIQKYETRVEGNESANVPYMDKTGMEIVKEYLPIKNESDYLNIWFQEPIDMATINTRHILNGFDVKYPTAYINSKSTINPVFRISWYFIIGFAIFMAIDKLVYRSKSIFKFNNLKIIIPISLASIAVAIPGAVETRFFIFPILMLFGITISALQTNWRDLWNHKQKFILSILFVLVFGIAFYKYSAWVELTRYV